MTLMQAVMILSRPIEDRDKIDALRDDLMRIVETQQGEALRGFASMCQTLSPEARFLASVHLGITIGLQMAKDDRPRMVLQ